MAKVMTLPKIGVNMTEAVIDKWLVKPGDTVKEGDAILQAETDKATQDIYATESGVVGRLIAAEGDKVQIYEPIMLLVGEGEELSEETPIEPEAPASVPPVTAPAQAPAVAAAAPMAGKSRVRISPLAKRVAREMGLDVASLKPGKPGARIVKEDVLAFAAAKPQPVPAPQPEPVAAPQPAVFSQPAVPAGPDVLEVVPMSGTRRIIAARMREGHMEQPSAVLTMCVRAEGMMRLRELYKARDIKISYNDIIVKAVAEALTEHRMLNSTLAGDEIRVLRPIHIGVAVDSGRGLLVPVLRDADAKSLRALAQEFAEKAAAAKEGRIAASDLSGSTFTVTNLGMFGIEQFTPIINPPECAILAVGGIKREFVPDENDAPVAASTVRLTLAFDHRVVDGAPAAAFLQRVKQLLECPELMI